MSFKSFYLSEMPWSKGDDDIKSFRDKNKNLIDSMKSKWIHFSEIPPDKFKFRNTPDQNMTMKPFGLWIGEGTEWLDFITNAGQGLTLHDYVYNVTPNFSTILHISDDQQIIQFNDTYSMDEMRINWFRVSQDYSGIIIAPYNWKFRLKYMWYYGWDVASGCIWNEKGIQNIQPLGKLDT
jgi:hypothetical protein